MTKPVPDDVGIEDHDEPNCDPSVDCKFVGPRDCPCRCHEEELGLRGVTGHGSLLARWWATADYDLPGVQSLASLLHGSEFDGMFRPDLRVVDDELDRSEREGTHGR